MCFYDDENKQESRQFWWLTLIIKELNYSLELELDNFFTLRFEFFFQVKF